MIVFLKFVKSPDPFAQDSSLRMSFAGAKGVSIDFPFLIFLSSLKAQKKKKEEKGYREKMLGRKQ